jgi:hypothetical protein
MAKKKKAPVKKKTTEPRQQEEVRSRLDWKVYEARGGRGMVKKKAKKR